MNKAPAQKATYGFGIYVILFFTIAYLTLSAPLALKNQNHEFIFYIAETAVLAVVVGFVHLRIGLSMGVLWCLSFWGLSHMVGGLMSVPESWPILGERRVLYNLWLIEGMLKYDQIVHAYGFGIVTWLCWQILRRIVADGRALEVEQIYPTLGLLTFSAAAAMGFGA